MIEKLFGVGDCELRNYVLSAPNSLLYASPEFIGLSAEHLNAEPGWLIARSGGDIVGVLPFLVRGGPLGPVFNSLAYYGSNGGVVQVNPDQGAKIALIDAFYGEAREAGACSATIITNPLEQDAALYEANARYDHRDERIGQFTHFPSSNDAADLLRSFKDPRPRNIRRALKEGVRVSSSHDESAVRFLYNVHVDNMLAVGGLAKSMSFFDDVKRKMPESMWRVYVARLGEKSIAALLLFYFNRTVEYFTPAIVAEHRNSQALALTIYEAMKEAMSKGYRNWNWGGTWLSQSGVYDFKKRWGTAEYRYFYYCQVNRPQVMGCEAKYLLEHYRGFFVLPFETLHNDN